MIEGKLIIGKIKQNEVDLIITIWNLFDQFNFNRRVVR